MKGKLLAHYDNNYNGISMFCPPSMNLLNTRCEKKSIRHYPLREILVDL